MNSPLLVVGPNSMKASVIRASFQEFFGERGHRLIPSASLVPMDDPTLLFVNSGMVPFKRIFLGAEVPPHPRAVTAQKCVRAGGKHNDLEQVGVTSRHHTFFEMLGNFSFGDYFKEEAVRFAWDFLVDVAGVDADRLYITVHHSDDEAARLWAEVVGVDPSRIFRLGDRDNFWQMADTGPCGPCSEIHYDLRGADRRATETVDQEIFERGAEEGEFLELWNLVFMQFDRDAEGTLHPLPRPSIDTGAGLERLSAVLQGVDSNYHSDLFLPLLDRVGEVVGVPYDAESEAGISYRVLADHARAVVFLLGDGVHPSNEGRGYVLRRILRRAVRHAWLLGRREATLVHVADAVIEEMSEAYPTLRRDGEAILKAIAGEEERFLATIEGGMHRFDELAPPLPAGETGILSGEDCFRLYDTFGFPFDLTELMARERGYGVDEEGFEAALEAQRRRSRADRSAAVSGADSGGLGPWRSFEDESPSRFVGYERTAVETAVTGIALGENGRAFVRLAEVPFYAAGGGQVRDAGTLEGEGWRIEVDEVRRGPLGIEVGGTIDGDFPFDALGPIPVTAKVDRRQRLDTERNHTATHLLHAALRTHLGHHVSQRGSLVAPDRLRFDFSHPAPLSPLELEEIERMVSEAIWADSPVVIREEGYDEAVSRGAMALFGEKYGEVVRVVEIPDVSIELCGGTHVRHTGEIGPFRIVQEGGVAAGVRRVEALTGPEAVRHFRGQEERLATLASTLRVPQEGALRRLEQLLEEKETLERLLKEVRAGGGAGETEELVEPLPGGEGRFRAVRMSARGADDVRSFGDLQMEREEGPSVLLVAADFGEGRWTLFAFVSESLIAKGVRADAVVRAAAAAVGGRGGGRPHLAQAGVEDPERLDEAFRAGARTTLELLSARGGE